jgi:hypothetical protein
LLKVDNVIHSIDDKDSNTGSNDDNNDSTALSNPDTTREYRTKIGFLDSDVKYAMPVFTHTMCDDTMIVTLEVKNVSEESIAHVCFAEWKSIHLKFMSIGAGHFPLYHAFYIDFLQDGSFSEEDISVECWDNNVVLQFPWQEAMANFKVGVSGEDLKDKKYTIQKSAPLELSVKSEQESVSSKTKKYTHEKHPKFMYSDSQDKQKTGKDSSTTKTSPTTTSTTDPTTLPQAFTSIRERHSSAESMDSLSMSSSPYDTVLLEQQHMQHLEKLQEEQQETASESDSDGSRQIKRSVSAEEGAKNIIKPRQMWTQRN